MNNHEFIQRREDAAVQRAVFGVERGTAKYGSRTNAAKRFKVGDLVVMTPARLASSMWRGEAVDFKVVDVYDSGNFDYQIQSQEANKGSAQVKESEIQAA